MFLIIMGLSLASYQGGPSPTSSWPTLGTWTLSHTPPACHVTLGPLSSCQVLTHACLLSLSPLPGAMPHQTASLDWSHSSDQKPFSVPSHHALGRGAPARLDALPHRDLQRQMGAASSRPFGAISGSLALVWIAGLGERRKLEGPRWAPSQVERLRPSFVRQGLWHCHPLELPPDDAFLEDGRLPGCWEHSGDQACPGGYGQGLGLQRLRGSTCKRGARWPICPLPTPVLVSPQGRKGAADERWPAVGPAHCITRLFPQLRSEAAQCPMPSCPGKRGSCQT